MSMDPGSQLLFAALKPQKKGFRSWRESPSIKILLGSGFGESTGRIDTATAASIGSRPSHLRRSGSHDCTTGGGRSCKTFGC